MLPWLERMQLPHRRQYISRYAAINEGGDKSSGINRRPHLCTLLDGHVKVSRGPFVRRRDSYGTFVKRYFTGRGHCCVADCSRKKFLTSVKNNGGEREIGRADMLRYYRPLLRPFISTKFDIPSSRNARCGLVCCMRRILLRSLCFMFRTRARDIARCNRDSVVSSRNKVEHRPHLE